jgi:hypothetical protein
MPDCLPSGSGYVLEHQPPLCVTLCHGYPRLNSLSPSSSGDDTRAVQRRFLLARFFIGSGWLGRCCRLSLSDISVFDCDRQFLGL